MLYPPLGQSFAGFEHLLSASGKVLPLVLVSTSVDSTLWFLWGGQADVDVPAEGMDKLQRMVPVTGFRSEMGHPSGAVI